MSARESLWMRLREAGVAEGDAPAPGEGGAPWFVRVMLGIAGWIGALFLLGFVGVGFAFVMKSSAASVMVGACACAAAVAVFRAAPRNDFVAQFGLAVGLAGQVLLVFGWGQWFERSSATGIALALAAQQAALFVLVPNFVHRVWTAWSGATALSYALVNSGLQAFVPAAATAAFLAVWLHEFDYPRRGELLRAGGYGLALVAVQAAVLHAGLFWLWWARGSISVLGGEAGAWLGALAAGAVLIWAVIVLLHREGLALGSGPGKVALSGAAILALVSLKAPGVGPAAAILVVGYANGNRVLAGLGILALLGYLSHYYYSLHATLLAKSALLACAGLALLAARFALQRWWPQSKGGAEHA